MHSENCLNCTLNKTDSCIFHFLTAGFEIEKVPSHIPVLVLGNHRDMGHHRTVTEDKARYFCNHFDR
jgi:hypothetical protein